MRQTIPRVDVIVDGQAGSCGKGKIAAHLALLNRPDFVVANFGPNAGHTVVIGSQRMVFRHLPAGSICQSAQIFIGAAALIDFEILLDEIQHIEDHGIEIRSRLHIHPRAAVITQEDRDYEQAQLKGIASTMKGIGSAQARKIMRVNGKLAVDVPALRCFTKGVDPMLLIGPLQSGATMQIETSQGFDLCINHGIDYPRCTSRQVSAAQAIADTGIPMHFVRDIYGVIRPYPIRVGNITDGNKLIGYSGDYDGSAELSWEKVASDAGMKESQKEALLRQELTTVTGRQRRVFAFNWPRFRRFVQMVGPTRLCLNFADQICAADYGITEYGELTRRTCSMVETLEQSSGIPVRFIGTGPDNAHIVDTHR